MLARLRGSMDTRRRDELLERFELDPRKKGRTYSKGNRPKVAIVAALASDVELLIMDEPTTGLDPLMEAVFQDCINPERAGTDGTAVQPHPVRDRSTMRSRQHHQVGAVVETGTLFGLRHLTRTSIAVELDSVPDALRAAAGVHDLAVEGSRIHVDVYTAEIDSVMRILVAGRIRSLSATLPTLEELFTAALRGRRRPARGRPYSHVPPCLPRPCDGPRQSSWSPWRRRSS